MMLPSSRLSVTRLSGGNSLLVLSKTLSSSSSRLTKGQQLLLEPNHHSHQQIRFVTSSWSSILTKDASKNNDMNQQQQQRRPVWSEEWKSLGLGASLIDEPKFPKKLMFVQVGFGVDQHGKDDATKASIRAVRNAIEFNSIPGIIEHVPGGRNEMLIHVKLGVPSIPAEATAVSAAEGGGAENNLTTTTTTTTTMPVDPLQVAKVFPYGKLLPIDIVQGGLDFATGRIVEELGDTNDRAICVVACISIGYVSNKNHNRNNNPDDDNDDDLHTIYNTKDGY